MPYLIIFFLGLIIGSFLNVVILRFQTGRTLRGRSGCFSCGKKLNWYELVPVFSFLIQKGHCRGCRSKISWQYPIVELLTGILFVLIYGLITNNPFELIFYWVMVSILVVVFFYDLKHQIIPDQFILFLVLMALVRPLIFSSTLGVSNLGWAVIGGIITSLPLLVLWLISRGRWLGFGDVKLSLVLGLFLGWQLGLSALVISFWLGAIIGVALIFWGKTQLWRKGKSYTMKSEIPFAPFLILGFWLVFFFSINVFIF